MYEFTNKCIEQAVSSLIRNKHYAVHTKNKKKTYSDETDYSANPVLCRNTNRDIFDRIIENLFAI